MAPLALTAALGAIPPGSFRAGPWGPLRGRRRLVLLRVIVLGLLALLVDRNGRVLVGNQTSWLVLVDPSELGAAENRTLDRLASLLGVPRSRIDQRLRVFTSCPFAIPVAEHVDTGVLFEIAEHPEEFPGVSTEPVAVRSYPDGAAAAQVLGYVGPVTADELKAPAYRRGSYGAEPIQTMARRYGLGQATGIALPGEATGRVDSPTVRQALHRQAPQAFPSTGWYAGDNLELAFGQGGTVVTPLQLADAYATFANGGARYAIAVSIDQAGYGASAAAPVARQALEYLAGHPVGGVRSPG